MSAEQQAGWGAKKGAAEAVTIRAMCRWPTGRPETAGGHRRLGLSLLAGGLVVAGIIHLSHSAGAIQAADEPTRPPVENVRQTFLSDCAVCHGADGHGTRRGPTLVGVGKASTHYQLSTGRMPLAGVGRVDKKPGSQLQPLPNQAASDPSITPNRHRPAYGAQSIAGLVDYVSELTGGGGPDVPSVGRGDLAEGGELFRLQCAACHAWAGDGGALLRRAAPALHAATGVQVAEAIRVGPGQMPAFGAAALTDHQVDSVVAYVRYLDRPRDRGGNPLWHLGPFAEGAVALVGVAVLLVFSRWIGERG